MLKPLSAINRMIREHEAIRAQLNELQTVVHQAERLSQPPLNRVGALEKLSLEHHLSWLEDGVVRHHSREESVLSSMCSAQLMEDVEAEHREIERQLHLSRLALIEHETPPPQFFDNIQDTCKAFRERTEEEDYMLRILETSAA